MLSHFQETSAAITKILEDPAVVEKQDNVINNYLNPRDPKDVPQEDLDLTKHLLGLTVDKKTV